MEKRLKILALVEGVSFLLLMFVAMPIKYIGKDPVPVHYMGMLHGTLFLCFCVYATYVSDKNNWPKNKLALAYLASVIPFGPFIFEKKLFE